MKKITVKGIGKIHERPDCITISFSLRAHEMTYEAAMEVATKQIASLRDALVAIGFEPADLKTTDFNVSTDYKSVYIDNKRNTKDVFNGYICEHDLKLVFDFDTVRMNATFRAIAGVPSHPKFTIRFSLKDHAAAELAMLKEAATNARQKAVVLCTAAGAALGELLEINYSWSEIDFYSHTRYLAEDLKLSCLRTTEMDMQPDDIDEQDTATFVWEIK
jgi:uncharacterized protein YggE